MEVEVKEVKPVDPPKQYVLTFDQVELDIVVAALGRCGGYDGPKGYRVVLNAMYGELHPHALKRNVMSSYGMAFDGFDDRVAYPND
jgi:hypothetical protein